MTLSSGPGEGGLPRAKWKDTDDKSRMDNLNRDMAVVSRGGRVVFYMLTFIKGCVIIQVKLVRTTVIYVWRGS